MNKAQLAPKIDHTLLKSEATGTMIDKLCDEALEYGFAAVCVNPVWVRRCGERLGGSTVHVASVAGFPLGANRTEVKADEARRAIDDGAGEIDMVVNLGELIGGNHLAVTEDIAGVAEAVHKAGSGNILKVILETAALTEEQIMAGCRCAADAGADFVKTSTGFHPAGGATVEAVRLLKRYCGGFKVKAAGGIRDWATARAMLDAGADRLGCSAGIKIINEIQGFTR